MILKNSFSFRTRPSSSNILSIQRHTHRTIKSLWSRFRRWSFNLPNFHNFPIFIPRSIRRIKWISRSFRLKLGLCNIIIIHIIILPRWSSSMLPFGLRAFNIWQFHRITCLIICLFAWLWTFNVITVYVVTDEFWRSDRFLLNLSQIISRIQWVVSLSSWLKFNTLRLRASNVIVPQIEFRFVQTYMKRSRARAVNVPVLRRIRLHSLFRSMKFWLRSFNIVSVEILRIKSLRLEHLSWSLDVILLRIDSLQTHQISSIGHRVIVGVFTCVRKHSRPYLFNY